MARRKKSSPAEDVVQVVAMIPWWGGLLLALVSFFVLDHYASRQVVLAPSAHGVDMAAAIRPILVKGVASACRWLVPALCVLGAAISAWKQWQRQTLLTKVVQNPDAAAVINGLTWQQFELLVGQGFKCNGYSVVENGGGGADGGVDLYLRKGGERYLVQCKQWRALKVSVTVVRELYGVMAASGAAGGYVVTSGTFTPDALAFAAGKNIKLIDGPELVKLIREGRQWAHVEAPINQPVGTIGSTAPHEADGIACPLCQKPMVRRTAKKGVHAGVAFWGCSAYPACKGTRS